MCSFRRSSRQSSAARVLVECSPHRTTGGGFLPGLMDHPAEHESYNERNGLEMLAICHDVKKIWSQRGREPYLLDGKHRHHIPDFVVDGRCEGLRLEVKALTNLVQRDSLDKYAAIGLGYRERGINFSILVDAQIEVRPRFDSVKLLARYLGSKLPMGVVDRCNAALSSGPLSVCDFMARSSLQLVDVWTLIAQ